VRLGRVALHSRGDWQLELDTGAVVELGQGQPDALAARFKQFAATAKEIAARHQRTVQAIESADLRHVGGYALRLHGVAVRPETPATPSAAARH
jgi:cell division protein FtsQ